MWEKPANPCGAKHCLTNGHLEGANPSKWTAQSRPKPAFLPTSWVRLGWLRHASMLKPVTVGRKCVRRHRTPGAPLRRRPTQAAEANSPLPNPGARRRSIIGVAVEGPAARTRSVEGAVPSPLAGHAVNPSLEARWRHPCRHTVRKRRGHRTRQLVGAHLKAACNACASDLEPMLHDRTRRIRHCSYVAYRPSRRVLARSPSRDLTRHGCRARAYRDVLAACPAMVGGQGHCSQATEVAAPIRQQHPTYRYEGAVRPLSGDSIRP